MHALTSVGLGQHERAVELYRSLLGGAEQPADLHLLIAHSLKTLGHRDDAVDEYWGCSRRSAWIRGCLLEPCEPENLSV